VLFFKNCVVLVLTVRTTQLTNQIHIVKTEYKIVQNFHFVIKYALAGCFVHWFPIGSINYKFAQIEHISSTHYLIEFQHFFHIWFPIDKLFWRLHLLVKHRKKLSQCDNGSMTISIRIDMLIIKQFEYFVMKMPMDIYQVYFFRKIYRFMRKQ